MNTERGWDIYIVPIGQALLLYSPLRQLSALVNRPAVNELTRSLRSGVPPDAGDHIQQIWSEIQANEPLAPAQLSGDINPAFLGIIPTRRCNGACRYCDFGAGKAQADRMDFRTVTTAVDWMAETVRQAGRRTLDIHFFGGEPLVESEVVEVAVHRTRLLSSRNRLTPCFETATNGVVTEQLAAFLGDYFDTVVLSLDGFPEIHDRHRPLADGRGSFEAAARTASVLSDRDAKLSLRCCVSNQNVTAMPDIAIWFSETFRPSAVNFEPLNASPECEAAGIFPPDPVEFARGFLHAERRLESVGIETTYGALSPEGPRYTGCPVGKDVVIVWPDGRLAGCYQLEERWRVRGLDLSLGQIRDGEVWIDPESVERLRHLVLDKPRCRHCFCRWECAGSCHVEITYPGCPATYPDFCIQTRLIFACHLLQNMRQEKLAEQLLDDADRVASLAQSQSDRLEDWT